MIGTTPKTRKAAIVDSLLLFTFALLAGFVVALRGCL